MYDKKKTFLHIRKLIDTPQEDILYVLSNLSDFVRCFITSSLTSLLLTNYESMSHGFLQGATNYCLNNKST